MGSTKGKKSNTAGKVSGKKKKKEGPPHKWKPGQSGNPAGRKRGIKSIAEQIRDQFDKPASTYKIFADKAKEMHLDPDKTTIGEMFILNLILKGLDGSLTSEVLNRSFGRIPETIHNETIIDVAPLEKVTEKQLRAYASRPDDES